MLTDASCSHLTPLGAVIRQAYDSRGGFGVSVAGKTWEAPLIVRDNCDQADLVSAGPNHLRFDRCRSMRGT
jgi:hypothetical protein